MKRIKEDKERSELIYKMRCERKFYREIADQFGICKTRAKQIFCREHARRLAKIAENRAAGTGVDPIVANISNEGSYALHVHSPPP